MAFVSDTFTGADGTNLDAHTGETGATWTKHTAWSDSFARISDSNRLKPVGGVGVYYPSGAPATAEYDITADIVVKSATGLVGVLGREDTTAKTGYLGCTDGTTWTLYKIVAGAFTSLGTFSQALTLNQTYALKLQIRDAAKKVFVDGVERISSADNAIATAGFPCPYMQGSGSNTTAIHLDNFIATNTGTAFIPKVIAYYSA